MGYRGKVAEQARARDLRAAGRTVPDIAAELGVSRSSVSLWVRDVPLPAPLRRRVGHRGPNALQRRKAAEIAAADEAGRSRIGDLSDRDLLIAGTALYAGEGDKRDGGVAFANADPAMIRLFLSWLRTFFDVDESRLRIRIDPPPAARARLREGRLRVRTHAPGGDGPREGAAIVNSPFRGGAIGSAGHC